MNIWYPVPNIHAVALCDVGHNGIFPASLVFGIGWGVFDVAHAAGSEFGHVLGIGVWPAMIVPIFVTLLVSQFVATTVAIPRDCRLFLDLRPEFNTRELSVEEKIAALSRHAGITDREQEVFVRYVQGRSRAYIAKELYLSESAVRDRISSSYRKLGIHDKQQLIDMVERAKA